MPDKQEITWEMLEEIRADDLKKKQSLPHIAEFMPSADESKRLEQAKRMIDGPSEDYVAAIRELKDDPEAIAVFDRAYGKGAAEAVSSFGILETTGDVFKAPISGAALAYDELSQSLEELAAFGADTFGTELGEGFADPRIPPSARKELEAQNFEVPSVAERVGVAETTAGKVVEGVAQFAAGFAVAPIGAIGKAHKIGKWGNAMARGMFSDAFAFDPDDGTVADLGPMIGVDTSVITDYLKSDDTSDAEKRLYRALEGVLAGAAIDGVFKVLGLFKKGLKSGKLSDADKAGLRETVEEMVRQTEIETGQRSLVPEGLPRAEAAGTGEPIKAAIEETTASAPRFGNIDRLFSQDLEKAFGKLGDEAFTGLDGSREGVAPRALQLAREVADRMNAGESVDTIADSLNDMLAKDLPAFNVAIETLSMALGEERKGLVEAIRQTVGNPSLKAALEAKYDRNLAAFLEVSLLDSQSGRLSGQILKSRQFDAQATETVRGALTDSIEEAAEEAADVAKPKGTKAGDKQVWTLEKLNELRRAGVSIEDAEKLVDEMLASAGAQDLSGAPRAKTNSDKASLLTKLLNGANEFRINAMLSGPKTLEINVASGVANAILTPAVRALGGDRNAASFYSGMARSWSRVGSDFLSALKEGDIRLTGGDAASRLETSTNAIPGAVGSVIRVPGKLLMATDAALKQMNYSGAVWAEGVSIADAAGLKGSEKMEFVKGYVERSFDESGFGLNPAGREYADKATFTADFDSQSKYLGERTLGKLQRGFMANPWSRLLVTPFFRTPMRLFEQGFRMTPGANLVMGRFRDDLLGRNGVGAAYTARGQMAVGMAMMTSTWMLAEEGRITGVYRWDKNVKEPRKNLRVPPESIKIGDQWFSYSQWEPLATVIRITATAVERKNRLLVEGHDRYVEDIEQINALMAGAFTGTLNSLRAAPMMEGIDQWFKLAESLSDENTSAAEAGAKTLASFAKSFTPNLLNKALNSADIGEDGGVVMREASDGSPGTFNQQFLRGNSTGINDINDAIEDITGVRVLDKITPNDPVRDNLGRVITRNGAENWWIAAGRHASQNEVLKEIARIETLSGVSLAFPGPKKFGADLRRLKGTKGQSVYDQWKQRTGTIVIDGPYGKLNLEDTIKAVVASDQYTSGNYGADGLPGRKAWLLREVLKSFRDAAITEIVGGNGDLKSLRVNHEFRDVLMLKGETDVAPKDSRVNERLPEFLR